MTLFLVLLKQHYGKTLLIVVWFTLLIATNSLSLIPSYGGFALLGIIGAIFANATGAGGGVVFVPFFNQLSMSSDTVVATSFAIQCCGMTAGALSWFRHYKNIYRGNIHKGAINKQVINNTPSEDDKQTKLQWMHLGKGLLFCVPSSIVGILSAQFFLGKYTEIVQASLHFYFAIFSILLALVIFASIPLMQRVVTKTQFTIPDLIALSLISLVGGVVTAWLSVGVGELVAVYIILRGFNVSFAIALAVILTAFSVQSAVVYHLLVSEAINFQIVLFAGAGAIVGGFIAKHVVLFFSPIKLKVFFGTWVLIMGLAGLPY